MLHQEEKKKILPFLSIVLGIIFFKTHNIIITMTIDSYNVVNCSEWFLVFNCINNKQFIIIMTDSNHY